MHEDGQTFGPDLFSMFHKIGSCSTLYFCVVNANYFMKTKGSVFYVHLDFKGKICEKKVHIING